MKEFFITDSSAEFRNYTLPVWIAGAARAALEVLNGNNFVEEQIIKSPDEDSLLQVPIQSAALIGGEDQALSIVFCDSGLPLDLTRGMELWVFVKCQNTINNSINNLLSIDSWLYLKAGIGVGISELTGEICISTFAKDLLKHNLYNLVPKDYLLIVEVVLPRGKILANRTSNQAFGVVDGLALIGTQSIANQSASPEKLKLISQELCEISSKENFEGNLVYVIGENGFDLAIQSGLSRSLLIKVGNWIGPSLVEAAQLGVKKLLLFGYHGKLIKLAGGIFHTHHHLADGRLEVLISLAVREGLPLHLIKCIDNADSVEGALKAIEEKAPMVSKRLWGRLANTIEYRSQKYLAHYGSWSMEIGVVLFDRERSLRWAGKNGMKQLKLWGGVLKD